MVYAALQAALNNNKWPQRRQNRGITWIRQDVYKRQDRNRYRDNQMKNNNHNRIDEQKNAEEKRFQKRKAEYLKKRRRRRQMRMFKRYLLLAGIAVGAVFLISAGVRAISRLPIFHPGPPIAEIEIPSWITQDFLTPNPYSRPQKELKQVNGVVVHYVGNPGTTAKMCIRDSADALHTFKKDQQGY